MPEIQTGVDELMQLLQEHKKISLKEASTRLETPETTIQAWVDFLVEDQILGIEYKFTTPYIYIHNPERAEQLETPDEDKYTLKDYKNGFYQEATNKELPEKDIPRLWKEHLRYVIEQNKEYFFTECKKRAIPHEQELFIEYTEEVRERAS
ncbi:MAG: hypothetical protein ACMXYD_02380 [Candidatus Woesearchaeota archaeon]